MKKRNGQHKVEPVLEIAGEEVGVSVESSGGNGQRPGVGIPGSEDVFAAMSRGGANMVREMSAQTQFIVITHSKRTMETASMLYGVTMEEPGISKIVSVRLN